MRPFGFFVGLLISFCSGPSVLPQPRCPFQPSREVSLQAGMYENKRVTAAFNAPIDDKVAARPSFSATLATDRRSP